MDIPVDPPRENTVRTLNSRAGVWRGYSYFTVKLYPLPTALLFSTEGGRREYSYQLACKISCRAPAVRRILRLSAVIRPLSRPPSAVIHTDPIICPTLLPCSCRPPYTPPLCRNPPALPPAVCRDVRPRPPRALLDRADAQPPHAAPVPRLPPLPSPPSPSTPLNDPYPPELDPHEGPRLSPRHDT